MILTILPLHHGRELRGLCKEIAQEHSRGWAATAISPQIDDQSIGSANDLHGCRDRRTRRAIPEK